MAYQQIPGVGERLGYVPYLAVPPAFANSAIANSGEKYAYCGRVFLPGRGSKNIQRICGRNGTVVSA